MVDICFIHGLSGNRISTWTAHGQSGPWPQTLLPTKLTNARILTYGYNAYVTRKPAVSSNRLIDHASNLLNDIAADRAACGVVSRPLIFVAHSLGGLICKEAILLSRNNPEPHLRDVFDSIKAIVFMGTPHKGSWVADWAKIPALALGLAQPTNRTLLETLETDSQFLESMQVRFRSTLRELRESGRRLDVTCFFEELPMPGVGIVVSRESATLEGYSSFSIHANHRDMVKFSGLTDHGFQRLLGELMRWESQIKTDATVNNEPSDSEFMTHDDREFSFPINSGSGTQFNTYGGCQHNNTGAGHQIFGDFRGPVSFG